MQLREGFQEKGMFGTPTAPHYWLSVLIIARLMPIDVNIRCGPATPVFAQTSFNTFRPQTTYLYFSKNQRQAERLSGRADLAPMPDPSSLGARHSCWPAGRCIAVVRRRFSARP